MPTKEVVKHIFCLNSPYTKGAPELAHICGQRHKVDLSECFLVVARIKKVLDEIVIITLLNRLERHLWSYTWQVVLGRILITI